MRYYFHATDIGGNIRRFFWRTNTMRELLGLWCVTFLLCSGVEAYSPMSDYTPQTIEGWKVLVNKELTDDHAELAWSTRN